MYLQLYIHIYTSTYIHRYNSCRWQSFPTAHIWIAKRFRRDWQIKRSIKLIWALQDFDPGWIYPDIEYLYISFIFQQGTYAVGRFLTYIHINKHIYLFFNMYFTFSCVYVCKTNLRKIYVFDARTHMLHCNAINIFLSLYYTVSFSLWWYICKILANNIEVCLYIWIYTIHMSMCVVCV